MSEQDYGPEVVPAPDGVIADDPFWSVVRRRHPDVDVVVLPPQRAGTDPETRTPAGADADATGADAGAAGELTVDTEAVARVEHDVVRRTWEDLIAGPDSGTGGPGSPVVTGRWLSGSAPDRVRREASAVVEDPERLADPVAGSGLLRRAEEVLRTHGWHVLVPPDGLPRLMASRPEGDGRRELLVLHAPAQGRLVLRVRGPELVVGRTRAHACVVSGG